MYTMTEAVLQGRQLRHGRHYRDMAGQPRLHHEGQVAGRADNIRVPGRHGVNDSAPRIFASTGGPGKPPEGGGAGGPGGPGGSGGSGGSGNAGGGPKPGGPRDLAHPVDYGETGGGTGIPDGAGTSDAGRK
jgi:hypothetical protein